MGRFFYVLGSRAGSLSLKNLKQSWLDGKNDCVATQTDVVAVLKATRSKIATNLQARTGLVIFAKQFSICLTKTFLNHGKRFIPPFRFQR